MTDSKKKHDHKRGGRCSYDEYKLDEELREQEEIKTEVIGEMRQQITTLLENQQRLSEALIAEGDLLVQSLSALRIYRERVLEYTTRTIGERQRGNDRCVPGCSRHAWDTTRGWTRNHP